MRLYTLSVLSQLTNTGNTDVNNVIVDWVNNKLKEVGKETKIQNFDDKSISSSKVLLALIDAMKPNSIKYELFKTSDTDEVISLNNELSLVEIKIYKFDFRTN